ncbi:hypothetical protein EV714DRAFT_286865 [Schizophyllum commune]
MTSLYALPEELLVEILNAAMGIPDVLFTDNSSRSPFATYTNNYWTSGLLLVSKTWYRIGLPELYHDVVLRSEAQVNALARSLDQNHDLACWVRKLRLEGCFGWRTETILRACTGITDLCLLTNPYQNDPSYGIITALPLINPVRLILLNMNTRKTQGSNARALVRALCRCAPTWTDLRTVLYAVPHRKTQDELATSLARAPGLTTVMFYSFLGIMPYHRDLCASNSVKKVVIRIGRTTLPDCLRKALQKQPSHIRSKLKFELDTPYDPQPISAAPTPKYLLRSKRRLSFKPLRAASAETWTYILKLVMASDSPSHTHTANERNLHVLLTCKDFFRVGFPEFLRSVLVYRRNVDGFVAFLRTHPQYSRHVRHLTIQHPFGSSKSILDALLCLLNSLESLRAETNGCTPINWEEFCLLSAKNKLSLEFIDAVYLDVRQSPVEGVPLPLQPLCQLAHLRHLSLASNAVFDTSRGISLDALYSLESLSIGQCDISLAWAFYMMRLPSLRAMSIYWAGSQVNHAHNAVLRRHGLKLRELELYGFLDLATVCACPYVRCLTVRGSSVISPRLFQDAVNGQDELTSVIFTDLEGTNIVADLVDYVCDVSTFPSLREVHWLQCEWPRNQHEIKASQLIPVVEEVFEDVGVRVYDGKGVFWIPRLK